MASQGNGREERKVVWTSLSRGTPSTESFHSRYRFDLIDLLLGILIGKPAGSRMEAGWIISGRFVVGRRLFIVGQMFVRNTCRPAIASWRNH